MNSSSALITHISDLHFGAEDPVVVDALVAELNQLRPDLVAISGDLTQGGRRREFAAARAFIDRLAAPVLAVPGNHDLTPYNLPERFVAPLARWRAIIGSETQPIWSNGRVVVAGLDTAHRAALHWDWSRGRVTKGRLQPLLARLAAFPSDRVRIVVAHHPFAAPLDRPRAALVGRAGPSLARLAAAGVRLVLCGHGHRAYAYPAIGGLGPLLVHASTATSTRLRGEANAYNRIAVVSDGSISVAINAWDGHAWRSTPLVTQEAPS